MKTKDEIRLLQDRFLEGELTDAEELQLKEHFEHNGLTDDLFFKDYFDYLQYQDEQEEGRTIHFPSPPSRLSPVGSRLFQTMAAAVLLLVIGFAGGRFFLETTGKDSEVLALRKDVDLLQKQVILMQIDQPLASDRIRAVQAAEAMKSPDLDLIKALGGTLSNDNDINVRLAAAYALFALAESPMARRELVNAIDYEAQEALVQLSLINMMFTLGEKSALDGIRKAMMNDRIPAEEQEEIELKLSEWL